MKQTKVENKVKQYVFPVGIGVALVLGLLSGWLTAFVPFLVSVLVLAGIAVGYYNVTEEEMQDFVFFTTALVVVATLAGSMLGSVQLIGGLLNNVLASVLAFVTPALIVVAVRAVMVLAKD